VPNDVAILAIGDDPIECGLTYPPLSGVHLPGERVGFEASRMLEAWMSGQPAPPNSALYPPSGVTVRRSTQTLAIDDPDVRLAMQYIADHVGEPMRVEDVVRQVEVSRAVLDKRFRSEHGHTVQQEISIRQMSRAKQLLLETTLPIAEVALACGFPHNTYLGIVLKRELGMTPREYRARFGRQ
jgi:LacI family transcriptional regulator